MQRMNDVRISEIVVKVFTHNSIARITYVGTYSHTLYCKCIQLTGNLMMGGHGKISLKRELDRYCWKRSIRV